MNAGKDWTTEDSQSWHISGEWHAVLSSPLPSFPDEVASIGDATDDDQWVNTQEEDDQDIDYTKKSINPLINCRYEVVTSLSPDRFGFLE